MCMIIRKIYGSGHIREKQQFENNHFLVFFHAVLFKATHFIKPVLIWKEHNNRRNTDIAGIVHIYFWQIEHEIRVFRLRKF